MPAEGFIVMGVAGCGKSTVGRLLAAHLGWDFFDADDFHPPANIAKMAAGIPLEDADRAPWLAALHAQLLQVLAIGRHPVLACSALKQRYRDVLLAGLPNVKVVYLKGSYEIIWARLASRPDHYMKPAMLASQFAALEEPAAALTLAVTLPPEIIVRRIVAWK